MCRSSWFDCPKPSLRSDLHLIICRKTLVEAVGKEEAGKLYPKDPVAPQEAAPAKSSSSAEEKPIGTTVDAVPGHDPNRPVSPSIELDSATVCHEDPSADLAPSSLPPAASAEPLSGEASTADDAGLPAIAKHQEPSTAAESSAPEPAAGGPEQHADSGEDGEFISDDAKPAAPASQPVQLRLARPAAAKPDHVKDGKASDENAAELEAVAVELITAVKPSSTGALGFCWKPSGNIHIWLSPQAACRQLQLAAS